MDLTEEHRVASVLHVMARFVGTAAPTARAPSSVLFLLFLGRTIEDEDWKAQGTCFALGPGAMYCHVLWCLRQAAAT